MRPPVSFSGEGRTPKLGVSFGGTSDGVGFTVGGVAIGGGVVSAGVSALGAGGAGVVLVSGAEQEVKIKIAIILIKKDLMKVIRVL